MLTLDQRNLFEDPEITNFQFWADPETFKCYRGDYVVDGILAVDNSEKTEKYEATLFFHTRKQSLDFYELYHSCFCDWWFELADPSLVAVVENDRLVIKKLEELINRR